jgi:hypothetical protein
MGNGSFVPSINVDSCIIEEQDDHLVLAIRVPKATIVSNLPVFRALADWCGVAIPRVWSTRDDPPLMSDHREAYAAMEKAGADYDASPEDEDGGPLADRMLEAVDHERRAFDIMVATAPRTHGEKARTDRLRRRSCQATGRERVLGRWPANPGRESSSRRVGPRIKSRCHVRDKARRLIPGGFFISMA